jgi:hypothetical protein
MQWRSTGNPSNHSVDAAIHEAVMALPPDERRDRAKVNEAVRNARTDPL